MKEIDKKQQRATMLIIAGCILSFHSSTAKAQGPATSALKIFAGLGGAGCCIAGMVLQLQPPKK